MQQPRVAQIRRSHFGNYTRTSARGGVVGRPATRNPRAGSTSRSSGGTKWPRGADSGRSRERERTAQVGATRPVSSAISKARFGVMNGRPLRELTGAGSDRIVQRRSGAGSNCTPVVKAVSEPAP
jgi:hypothetical protein